MLLVVQTSYPGYCCKGATYLSGLQLSGEPCTTVPTANNSYYKSVCSNTIHNVGLHGVDNLLITLTSLLCICFTYPLLQSVLRARVAQ